MLKTNGTPNFGEFETADDRLEIQVYKKLLDQIRFGALKIGQKLPSEHELCDEHGVSRPVIRAALSKLRDSGLIVSRRGSGSFVNAGAPNEQTWYAPLVSVQDISQFFQFRRLIEAATAELAAQNATAAGIQELRAAAEEVAARIASGEDAVLADVVFHTTIAKLSGNRFLIETIEMLVPNWKFVGNFLRSLAVSGDRRGIRMLAEHAQVVDAIARNDPNAAKAAILNHVDGSERRVFKGT